MDNIEKISLGEYSILYVNFKNVDNKIRRFSDLIYLSGLYKRCLDMNNEVEIDNFAYKKKERLIPNAKIEFINETNGNKIVIELDKSKGTNDFVGLVKRLLGDKGYELENGENELEL